MRSIILYSIACSHSGFSEVCRRYAEAAGASSSLRFEHFPLMRRYVEFIGIWQCNHHGLVPRADPKRGFGKLEANGPKSLGRMTQLSEKGDLPHEIGSGLKIRVPDTFQLCAILPFSAFFASRRINNLRVFNERNIPTPPASTNPS